MSLKRIPLLLLTILSFTFNVFVYATNFKLHDPVQVVVNKIGPFNNPSETYRFYSLPFCRSEQTKQKGHDLGEILVGDRKVISPYEINFLDNVENKILCDVELGEKDKKLFKDAIEDQFYFEMFIDNLPMWGYIGEVEGSDILLGHFEERHVYLFTHFNFFLGYNNDQIVSANISANPQYKADVSDESEVSKITFSYSVQWKHEPYRKFEDRMSRYVTNHFLPTSFEVHWLSVINSFILVLILTTFLVVILMRILKKDLSKYMDISEEDLGEQETGWKLIRGDVFRLPKRVNFLSGFLGTGIHLCCVTFLLLVSVLCGFFKPTKRGSILSSLIFIYTLTSFINGFVSSKFYRKFGGKNWVWNIVLSAFIFPVPLILVFMFVNSIAWFNNSTAALPYTTIIVILSLFCFVSLPLHVFGGLIGKNTTTDFEAPCRPGKAARQIPTDLPWFRRTPAQLLVAGFLPFSAIYIELHYIFASIWGHRVYTLFGILFIAFILLLIVSSFITIALVYFRLASEDHQWWWKSFVSGGMTGIFVFLYSFYYYFQRSAMDGFLQGSFFFGYMGLISYAFFLMLGSIGFLGSFLFVRSIYNAIKGD